MRDVAAVVGGTLVGVGLPDVNRIEAVQAGLQGLQPSLLAMAAAGFEPRTKEELHMYVRDLLGFDIPAVAPTEGHVAPLDFVADAFFGKVERALVLAARGQGKTRNVSILNLLTSKFRPQTHTVHFGAIGTQATWGHEYLRDMVRPSWMSNDIEVNTRGLLRWVNGSWVRPASGHTDTGVTAIRANRGVWDEIDLWQPEQFETSQMMVQGTVRNPAQRLYISTQYNAYGLMSTLLRAADVRGYKVFRWDVFCLTADTLVETARGSVRIDQMRSDDRVWSFDGGFSLVPIGYVGSTRKNASVLAVEMANGRVLKATPDHKVLTVAGWVRVRDLVVGSTVIVREKEDEELSGLWRSVRARVSPGCAVQRVPHEGLYVSSVWGKEKASQPTGLRELPTKGKICLRRVWERVCAGGDYRKMVSILQRGLECMSRMWRSKEAPRKMVQKLFYGVSEQGVSCAAGDGGRNARGEIEPISKKCTSEVQESKYRDAEEDECGTEAAYRTGRSSPGGIQAGIKVELGSGSAAEKGGRDSQASPIGFSLQAGNAGGGLTLRNGCEVGEGEGGGCVQSGFLAAGLRGCYRSDGQVLAQFGEAGGTGYEEEGFIGAGGGSAVGVVGRADLFGGGASGSLGLVKVVAIRDAGRSDVWDVGVPQTHNFVANGVVVHNSGMQQCLSCREHDCPLFVVAVKDGSGYEPLCKGRGLRSRGYIPYEAVIDEFLSTDLATWRVQKLLEEPEREYLILPTFDERKHVGVPPEAAFSPATVRACGVDWGYDHPLVFSVWAEVGDVFWGIHEHSERFVSPDREIEIAEALQEQFGTVSPSGAKELVFWCGVDRPEAIAQFNERGLIAVPCPIRMREARHRAMRRLLRQDRIKVDREAMPLTVFQLGTVHRDEKTGKEVLEGNDCFDAVEHVLGPAEEFGGLVAGGGFMA